MLGSEMPLPTVYTKDAYEAEVRDPCASPPCKRLKQGSIQFPVIIDDDETTQPTVTGPEVSSDTNQQQSTLIYPIVTSNNLIDNVQQSDNCDTPVATETSNNITSQSPSSTVTLTNDQQLTPPSKNGSVTLDSESKYDKPKTSPSSIKSGILKFAQPVVPCCQQTNNSQATVTSPPPMPGESSSIQDSPCLSQPKTPKQNEPCNSVVTPASNVQENTPRTKTPSRRKLSVEEKLKREEEKLKKQKEREQQEQERLEKRKEKERLKLEKERERQEEKKRKEQERLEQVAVKQQRDKERQEKKAQEEKEKQERLEKKEEEKRKRDEEKRKKEEEKNQKIEEKRKKEEEQSLKKQRVQNSFASFFIKKEVPSLPKQKEHVKTESKFQPFELKPSMQLARTKPIIPLSDKAKEMLNENLVKQVSATSLCLVKEELKKIHEEVNEKRKVVDLTNDNVAGNNKHDDDDIMIVDDGDKNMKQNIGSKPKLLQFHDNYRPAYFGTWKKKSKFVGPRTPLGKDMDLINYDVDSDDEWEEEEPGESLSNSEGEEEEKDEGKEENDEENDGFFVPHGYLSDDEGVADSKEGEEEDDMECTEESDNTKLPKPEDRMKRQLAKQKVWETEMKRQFKPMKPVAIGCIWEGEIPSLLKQLEACSLVAGSIDPTVTMKEMPDQPRTSNNSPLSVSSSTIYNTAMSVPEEAMPSLIKFVHGNMDGLMKMMKVFRKNWTLESMKDKGLESDWQQHCVISKRQLERKISEMAKKERRPILPKARWYVHQSVLAKYNMEDIALPTDGHCRKKSEPSSQSLVNNVTSNIKHFTQHASHVSSEGQKEEKDAKHEIPQGTISLV